MVIAISQGFAPVVRGTWRRVPLPGAWARQVMWVHQGTLVPRRRTPSHGMARATESLSGQSAVQSHQAEHSGGLLSTISVL